jgi:transaldolase / glucose-6-phosphate isomerase
MKADHPIRKLQQIGQSIWLDNLSRNLIQSGQLKRLIDEEGVTGITSNPTIFQKAISGSRDYDPSLQSLLKEGVRDPKELFLALAKEDISRAADLLRPVYESTRGLDGYVSIEVSPDLAFDTEKTIAEAKRLFSEIGKKNVLIKVPATPQGVPAIERLIANGVNVNVTLLFAVKRYEAVAEAYIRGLEQRSQKSLPIDEIASVASFFVSRVDTLTDKILEGKIASALTDREKESLRALRGAAAVANAKAAYKKFKEIFSGPRFRTLKGARIQRILWGSTGTKNPAYGDLKYVEELIGPDSINTVPEATLTALLDHGKIRITVLNGPEDVPKLFAALKAAGVEMDQVTADLEKEGVKLFADSFTLLLKEIADKRDTILSGRR